MGRPIVPWETTRHRLLGSGPCSRTRPGFMLISLILRPDRHQGTNRIPMAWCGFDLWTFREARGVVQNMPVRHPGEFFSQVRVIRAAPDQ